MNQDSLWKKIKASLKNAGKQVIYQALLLYYTYPNAPKKIKTVIASSLAYFILPLDSVPDPIPFLGFLDDAAVLAAAVGIVRLYVTEESKQKAQTTLDRFLKDDH